MKKILMASAATLAILASCSGNGNDWTVKGNVSDAADSTLYLEASTLATWYPVDSAKLDSKGDFAFKGTAIDSTQTIYRLRLGEKSIYFPVDAAQQLQFAIDGKSFDRQYSVSGSLAAAKFHEIDSLVNASVDAKGARGALADADLKHAINLIVNRDTTCIVSYYAVGKFIDGYPLYDLTVKRDQSTLGNAANNYARLRPTDPRAEELKIRLQYARKTSGTGARPVEVEGVISGHPNANINLNDARGTKHNLEDMLGKGNVVVLNFSRADNRDAQANTLALNEVYNAYKGNGLKIYQIAFDSDELAWRKMATSLPWTAVYNSANDGAEALVAYNVDIYNGGPVSYVFDGQGNILERVNSPANLKAAVAKAF